MEQELKQLKTEKEWFEASGLSHRSGHAGPVAPCRVPGQPPMGASSAEPRAPNKKE